MIKLDDKTAVGFFYNFDFAAYARFHADPIVAAEYAVARDRVDLFYLQ